MALQQLVAGIGLLLFVVTEVRADGDYGNIHRGNVETGGSVSFSYVSPSGSGSLTSFSLSSPTQYFLIDRFSLGAAINYFHSSLGVDSLGVGPSATYYFWTQDRLATFAGEEFTYNKFPGVDYFFNNRAKLGINYFITPSVAIGPSLEYGHNFGRGNTSTIDSVSVLGKFSIYF